MNYLHGTVDPDDITRIVQNIEDGNRADARRAINAYPREQIGCIVLLVLDELIARARPDRSPADCSDNLFRLLEVDA